MESGKTVETREQNEKKIDASDRMLQGIAIYLYGSVLNGLLLWAYWLWFVEPVFDLPLLPLPAAFGIALIVNRLTSQGSELRTRKEREELSKDLSVAKYHDRLVFGSFVSTSVMTLIAFTAGLILQTFV